MGRCGSPENSGVERQITLRQGRHGVRDRDWHWCLMIWRSIALRASLQLSFADSAILSALQNSARDPLRTCTRASTANPHASAEAPYASSRSSASRHFILRLSVPQSYPSLRRTRWSIAPCTKHLKAHWIIVKKQNRFHSLCTTAPGRRPTAEGTLRAVPSRVQLRAAFIPIALTVPSCDLGKPFVSPILHARV